MPECIHEFGDFCPNCEKDDLCLRFDSGEYEVLCDNCGLIYYSSHERLDNGDIIFDQLCEFCFDYGVRYIDDDKVVNCKSCGDILMG